MYIELVDMGFRYIRKFYYNKLPIFNKYAKDVSDTTMESYEINKRVEEIVRNRNTWRIKPLEFDDQRFDFSDIEKKEEPQVGKIKPFEFINNSKYNNINYRF
jgi:hypothetical protein